MDEKTSSDQDRVKAEDPERREFLGKATGAVACAGIAAAAWPFISSMNPTKSELSRATTEAELGGMIPGETKTIEWQGKPVFILRRTQEQITAMEQSRGSEKDPQPDAMRVKDPNWLVVVGLCTHLGCVPTRNEDGWFCPCHGSVYDNSGRVLKGPAPRNLDLPPYQFAATNKIVIGNT